MKKIILSLIFLSLSYFCFSQNFKQDFREAFENQDTIKQLTILNEWEKSQSDDAELFVSYLNYYFAKAKKSLIAMTSEPVNEDAFVIKDSTDNEVAYLGEKMTYDKSSLQKGFEKIDRGIQLYPNRLDMRLGKIFTLGEIKSWELFTEEIIETIKQSEKNKNNWLWLNNEKVPEGKEVLLSSITTYQEQLYNTGNDNLLNNMQRIAKKVLNLYPNHVPSLSNLAITHILKKKYDKALNSLHKAEKLDPDDGIVLANIARVYELKNDLLTSKIYYQKITENPKIDGNLKEFAKTRLKAINK